MQKVVILTKNGDPEGVSQIDTDKVNQLRGKTFLSGSDKIGVIDTNQTISEESITNVDLQSLARQLGKILVSALRQHGDNLKQVTVNNITEHGCTVHVQYETDDQGNEYRDDFKFEFDGQNINLQGQEIGTLSQNSGQLFLQKDIVQNNLLKFLNSVDSPSITPNNQAASLPKMTECIDTGLPGDEDLILGFKEAVDNYRENPKDKERIKELFRQSRNFEGNSLPAKFKNAVDTYKICFPRYGSDAEESCTDKICINVPLLIKLFEHVREEVENDEEIHYMVENMQSICTSENCLTMEDYQTIVQTPTNPVENNVADEQ